MTDEQVKKGLECCTKDGTIKELCKKQCPYYEDCHTRGGDDKRIYSDALALINRLETECADKERYTIELYNRAREAEREINKWKQAFIEFEKFGDMTTPMGLLPINEEGMRKLSDYARRMTTLASLEVADDSKTSEIYDQICKQTAKDILQSFAQFRAVSPQLSAMWYELAKKYGIEVEE